jgi:hypothetical protein
VVPFAELGHSTQVQDPDWFNNALMEQLCEARFGSRSPVRPRNRRCRQKRHRAAASCSLLVTLNAKARSSRRIDSPRDVGLELRFVQRP